MCPSFLLPVSVLTTRTQQISLTPVYNGTAAPASRRLLQDTTVPPDAVTVQCADTRTHV